MNKSTMEDQMPCFKTSMAESVFWALLLNALAWSCFIFTWVAPTGFFPWLLICQTITVISAILLGIYIVIKHDGRKQWIGALGILLAWLNILISIVAHILKPAWF